MNTPKEAIKQAQHLAALNNARNLPRVGKPETEAMFLLRSRCCDDMVLPSGIGTTGWLVCKACGQACEVHVFGKV